MTKHRAEGPTLSGVVAEIRGQMSSKQIVDAVQALTIGDDPYKATLTVAGRQVRLENRGPDARMGRFGGGWMTSIGIQMGSRGTRGSIIVNLGKGSIRINPQEAS